MSRGQPSFVFQSGKASGNDSSSVIDLTMDDEESGTTQGTERDSGKKDCNAMSPRNDG